MPESNLLGLVDQLDDLRERLVFEADQHQVVITLFWLKELEDDLLCGFVALEQEFKRAWERSHQKQ